MATQSLGTLYVRLAAQTAEFVRGFSEAAEKVQKFAAGVKEVTEPIAGAAGALTAIGAASVALASRVDLGAFVSMKRLETASTGLAVSVSRLLSPALEELASILDRISGFISSLNPEVAKQVAHWAVYVVEVGAAAKAVGLLAGAIQGLAGVAKLLSGAFLSVGAPVLAAIAVITAAVVALHRAWRLNWLGIRQVVADVAKWLVDAFLSVGQAIYKVLTFPMLGFLDVVGRVLDGVAKMNNALGRQDMPGLSGFRDAISGLRSDIESGEVFRSAVQFAGSVAKTIGAAASEEIDIIGAEVKRALGFEGGRRAKAPQPSGLYDVGNFSENQSAFSDQVAQWSKGAIASIGVGLRTVAEVMDPKHINLGAVERAMRSGSTALLNVWEKARATADDLSLRWDDLAKTQQTMGNWAGRMGSTMEQATGGFGQLASTITQGVAAGGVIGGVVAGLVSLAQRMGSFQSAMGVVELALDRLGQTLEIGLGPVFEFVSLVIVQVFNALDNVMQAFKPVFDAFADVLLGSVLPAVTTLFDAFKFLTPLLEMFGQVLGIVMKPLLAIVSFGALTDALFYAIKLVVVGLGAVIGALTWVGGKIVQALAWVWEGLGSIVVGIGSFLSFIPGVGQAIAGTGAAMIDQARQLRESVPDMDKYWKDLETFWNLTPAEARARAEEDLARWRTTNSMDELNKTVVAVTQSLTNVPTGYKLALARFNAQSDMVPATAHTSAGRGGETGHATGTTIYGNVTINTTAPSIEEALASRPRKTGSPVTGGMP